MYYIFGWYYIFGCDTASLFNKTLKNCGAIFLTQIKYSILKTSPKPLECHLLIPCLTEWKSQRGA